MLNVYSHSSTIIRHISFTVRFYRTDSGPAAMVTPRAANYTSTRNEPPRVLTLQYIDFNLK